ncbi:hypothetical protein SAMN03159382_03950 [Pseudomonas sp. NFACC23-1]|nr:hypothetical protein SAMN03159386_03969 [Pseudomonas sp. NFACC17-2]SEJ71519.1 hypothetical protein SAMN03159382_03950 [Pseudomonas sp. NFACC23-1]SFW85943.1 hypothetical protein SAMN05660640_04466 [Pseudomonas sp. NFACC16-2]
MLSMQLQAPAPARLSRFIQTALGGVALHSIPVMSCAPRHR